jgi:DNA repair exonuclease SbcCD ATPase subunit
MTNNSNYLTLKKLTLRNFLSFGNKETVIPLDGDHITVILGENLDTGGEDSRNGVGKSAILDALNFVLFGKVIRGISNQKLVNKLADKGRAMLVTLEFDKGPWSYLVERGERPSRLQIRYISWEK